MLDHFKYDVEVFNQKIKDIEECKVRMVEYQKEFNTIINDITSKNAWRGYSATRYSERSVQALSGFNSTIQAIDLMGITLKDTIDKIIEADKNSIKLEEE